MKLHIGTDRRGLVHSVTATHAAESDIKQLPHLLHGEESELYGDQAYWKEADRRAFEEQGVRYRVNRRAPGGNKNLSARWRKINRARSRTRARCEHPFRVLKHLWGFQKVRYRGIAKNLARAQTMFALANLYAVRHRLLPPEAECVLCPTARCRRCCARPPRAPSGAATSILAPPAAASVPHVQSFPRARP